MKYFHLLFFVIISIGAINAQVSSTDLLAEGQRQFGWGQYQEAKDKLVECLTVQKKASEPPSVQALFVLGLSEYHLGQYQSSLHHLTQVQRIIKSISKEPTDDALIDANIGLVQLMLGEYAVAEKRIQNADQIATKLNPPNRDLKCRVVIALATYYVETKNYHKADELLMEQISALRKDSTIDRALLMEALNLEGELLLNTNRHTEAQALLNEAYALRSMFENGVHPLMLRTRKNLITLARISNDPEKAFELAKLTYDGYLLSNGRNTIGFANAAIELGIIYREQYLEENFRAALKYFTEAKTAIENSVGKKHLLYATVLSHLGWAHSKLSMFNNQIDPKNTVADKLFQESLSLTYANLRHVFSALSESEKKQYYEHIRPVFNNFGEYAITHTQHDYQYTNKARLGDWYDMLLATKGLLYHSSTQLRQRLLASGDPDLISRFTEWQTLRDSLAIAYQQSNERSLAQLEGRVNLKEKELSQYSASFKKSLEKKFSWRDVRKALKPNEAAVEIVTYETGEEEFRWEYYGALVIRYDQETPEFIPISSYPFLDRKLNRFVSRDAPAMNTRWYSNYKNSVLNNSADYLSYFIYWQQLDFRLSGIKKIYFSPEGVYHLINPATIRIPEQGQRHDKTWLRIDSHLPADEDLSEAFTNNQYLKDVMEVEVVLSTQDIVMPPPALDKLDQVILFGHPDYNHTPSGNDESTERGAANFSIPPSLLTDTSQRFFNGSTISELPGTQAEVQSIDNLLKSNGIKSQVYTREQANELNLKNVLSPTVLHIATHGYFRLGLAGASSAIKDHPFMQTGLLFSGARDAFREDADHSSRNNGVLTGWEAVGLRLDNTRLVILSACETGLGVVQNGEGVYGLQRAFQLAGAKAVLMSLWTVPDRATQLLMTEFYKEWLSGKPMRSAFNHAQQKIKAQYPDPHDWGGFVLIGN